MFLPFLLAAALAGGGQETPPDTATELLQLETTLFQAIHSRDRATLDGLLAADYILRGSPDIGRETWLANAVELCWGQGRIDNFEVRGTGTAAVATFLLTFTQDPVTCQPAVLRSLISDVWHLRDGVWQLALRHSGAPGSNAVTSQFGVAPQGPPPFEARAEVSMVSTGGNTSTRTLGVAGDALHRGRRATTSGRITIVRATSEGVENARSLSLLGRQGWRIAARTEGFARGEYLRDVFAGVEHRSTLEGGLSLSPTARPHALRLDASVGGTWETRVDTARRQFGSATGSATYRWIVSAQSELLADASVTADLQQRRNWRSSGNLSMQVTVSRVMSARVAYALRYLHEPVPGFRREDTTVSAALVLSYTRR